MSIGEFIRLLWSGKWWILAAGVISGGLGVAVALWLPNVYRSETLLAPNRSQSSFNAGALAAQYGGLASLAGIDIGGEDDTDLALQVLESRKFIADFVEQHDLLVDLFAVRRWNSADGSLVIDEDVYDAATRTWVRQVSAPFKPKPSLLEAYEEFTDRLRVSRDARSGFVTVGVEHHDPNAARQWAEWLVADLNRTLRDREVANATRAIEYLQDQIEQTTVADLREVFYRLVEEQMKTIMLAQASSEFALRTIDPPVAPEKKAKPKRALIVVLSGFLGGLLGVAFVVIRGTWQDSPTMQRERQRQIEGET